jgi:hypothetical protein
LESEPILKILEEYSRYREQLSSTRAGKLVNDMQELLKQAKDQVANELIQEEEDKKLREKQKKNKKLFSEGNFPFFQPIEKNSEEDLPDLNFVELIDVMHELQEKGQWSHKECIELMTVLFPAKKNLTFPARPIPLPRRSRSFLRPSTSSPHSGRETETQIKV